MSDNLKRDELIRQYNWLTGYNFKFSKLENQVAVDNALKVANGESREIVRFLKEYVKDHPVNLIKAFNEFSISYEAPKKEDDDVTKEKQNNTASSQQNALDVINQAVVNIITNMNASKVEEEVKSRAINEIKDFIQKEYGQIERKITTIIDGKKVDVEGVVHEKFDTILKFVANNEPVFLTGGAGCGKNFLCEQVAKALGLEFYFTNAVTQEYKLTGFTDAMGVYQETSFYKAFKNGGLFMLDEMDASIPEVLIILNSAIANKYFDFPAPIGRVNAHKDFRIISAGNTFGQGADMEYVGRNQLDMASLDRFAMVKMDYDKNIENMVGLGNTELIKFCRDFRKVTQKNGLGVVVSYRAIGRLAKMVQCLSLKEALETCLVKGLGKDDIKMIINGLDDSEYKNALKLIANEMED